MFISANTTQFLGEAFTAIDKTCVKSCVVVIRATYDVDLDGICRPSEEQSPFVYADTPYGDPATTSARVESDFVPTKPRAEVVLDAVAMAPAAHVVETIEVALVGPSLNKRAIVTGERRWYKGLIGMQATRPTPFKTLDLAWHLAFGGTDRTFKEEARARTDPRNPIGRGFLENTSPAAIDGQLLPCIEHPESRMTGCNDRPRPIGFGPVPRFAADRARFAGTYDQHWIDDVLPFLPADFDDRYYLGAPADQQLESLAEGTVFGCVNMSETGRFRVQLPALSVPVRFMFDDRVRDAAVGADTLILEPHKRRIVLLGRTGVALPRKFTRLREIRIGAPRPRAVRAAPVTGPS